MQHSCFAQKGRKELVNIPNWMARLSWIVGCHFLNKSSICPTIILFSMTRIRIRYDRNFGSQPQPYFIPYLSCSAITWESKRECMRTLAIFGVELGWLADCSRCHKAQNGFYIGQGVAGRAAKGMPIAREYGEQVDSIRCHETPKKFSVVNRKVDNIRCHETPKKLSVVNRSDLSRAKPTQRLSELAGCTNVSAVKRKSTLQA
jgi:hypothetical protein